MPLARGDKGLCKLGGLELLFAGAGLSVELPDMRALVEDVDVALDDARGGCGHLADDEADFRAVLGELDEVQLVQIECGRLGDVVEARGDSSTEGGEMREVREKAWGLVALDFAVLDRRAMEV